MNILENYSSWIKCPKPRPNAELRLFCFPNAGGGAAMFFPWNAAFDERIEINAVELPGQHSRFREKPFDDIRQLVEALLPVINEKIDKPFAFFGHSLGALLSFELTCALRKKKFPLPQMLFISSHRAPHTPQRLPNISHLTDELFIRTIQQRYGGIPETVFREKELMQIMLPGLRASFKMFENYRFQNHPPLEVPIFAFGGKNDTVVSHDELSAWRARTSATFELSIFNGGHFYLTEGFQTDLIAEIQSQMVETEKRKAA